jgi:hypothetical protein
VPNQALPPGAEARLNFAAGYRTERTMSQVIFTLVTLGAACIVLTDSGTTSQPLGFICVHA